MFYRPRRVSTDNRRQLGVSMFLLVLMLLVGSGGFYLLGESDSVFQCVYVTALILTTVGMKEQQINLNTAQQVWALGVMLVGISAALYAAGNVVAFIIDGELHRLFGRQQLQNKIGKLKDHYIVCGFGRMGRALCERLRDKKVAFVVIEHNPERAQEAGELGYLHIQGDAMSEHVLQSARVEHARGLATCLRTDADNVFVTLTARGLHDSLTIIARGEEFEAESKLRRAGADRVICLPLLGANRITHMLLQPGIDELLELAVSGPDLEVSKISLGRLPGAVGQSLRDLALPTEFGLMVVAVISPGGQRLFNPPPDSLLGADDELVVISTEGGVERMMQMFGAKQ